MARENLHATVLGSVTAVVVFAVLFYFAGVDGLIDRMTMAEPTYLIAILAITFVWLIAWGASLKTVLSMLGVNVSTARSFLIFMGAVFLNNITPFGQAGGEPVTAPLISRNIDIECETGPATVASVDTINFVLSITIALIGVGYYATEVTLGRNLEIVLVAVIAPTVGVPAAVYITWKRHYSLGRRLAGIPTPFIRIIARYVPRVSVSTNDGIERRVSSLSHSTERIGRDPRGLAIALGLSGFGWLCQMVALWAAFHAIGAPTAFSVALFTVPTGVIANMTPLPGDTGGTEWAFAILVTTVSPAASFDVATAGIAVFRGLVYWVPVVLGGPVTSTESARG